MTDSREHWVGREGGDWGTGIDRYMQAHACTFRHKTQRRHCQAQCTACLLVALSGCASACASVCASACLPSALATATAAVAAAQTIYVGAHAHAHFFCILPTALTVSTVCPTVCLCVCRTVSSLERETKFIARAFVLPTSARRLNVAFARQLPPPPAPFSVGQCNWHLAQCQRASAQTWSLG